MKYRCETKELAIGYGGAPLASGITLGAVPGQILALIGPNGAGKSTLLKTLAGQLAPMGGAVLLDGRNLTDYTGTARARKLALMLPHTRRTELTSCFEFAAAGRIPYTGRLGILSDADRQIVWDALELVGASPLADRDFSDVGDTAAANARLLESAMTAAGFRPYSAECYRAAFQQANTVVLTAAAERTFWEKVTILHHEANRPEHLPMPSRYSRHYYDLYCIAHSESKAAAYEDLDLLGRVVEFKMKFYPRKWAQYELARPGTMKLCPPEYRYAALEEDYAVMQGMMFGECPSFADLMAFIRELEAEINAL